MTQTYSAQDIKRLVDLPGTLVQSLIRAGHLRPLKRAGRVTYSAEDLLVMRTAGALLAAKIPSPKITEALGRIREALPAGSSLSVLAGGRSGQNIVAPQEPAQRESRKGRSTRPLTIDHRPLSATALQRRAAAERRRLDAEQHFAAALELEESDVGAARAGYIAALNTDSNHLEARINLGRLLHMQGELVAAEAVYRAARHASAVLSFNLAILLEDLSREEDAVMAYREALALDPALSDAHFNLSQLHERAERPREALRHLLAYRRHAAEREK
jgi:tetratricopeptide (TPR) repeat protein